MSSSINLPAVRKDFWEFLISAHPIEEEYAPSTKNAYRWRSVPELRLVIVQFVSQDGVGVFVRGERGANPDEVEDRLRPYAVRLKEAVGVDEFFFVDRGTPSGKYFFHKFKGLNSSSRENWGRMADWLHRHADAYQDALRQVMADGAVLPNATPTAHCTTIKVVPFGNSAAMTRPAEPTMLDATQPQPYNAYDAPHADLREFLARIKAAGELLRVPGAHWDLEMGTLAEIVYHTRPEPPAILFEDIPGYPKGMRLLSGATSSSKRLAITLGLPAPDNPLDVVRSYRDRMKTHQPLPPRVVTKGAVLENVDRDGAIDLYKFPVPRLHELDGGRYIGTDDLVIMRDPEENWINAATYRSMVQDKDRVSLWMSPGKHGRQIREKYFRAGKPCPVLISCGHDPLLFLAGGNELKFGLCEYDYAGGHRGVPYEVIESEVHGLPMPAHAEMVIEGDMVADETAREGPFGEFTGYYASSPSEQPVVRVRRVYYRNDPVLGIASPMRPPSDFSFSKCVMKAGMIWDEVERAGLSGVRGVWCHEFGGARMFNVIAIKQAYPGHARQAGMLAASSQSGSYLGRFVVVVDEDVDPTDIFDVMWAVCTRCDPVEDIEFFRRAWSTPLDPLLHVASSTNSRAVIDACRPFERLKDFPPVARASPELVAKVREKFAGILAKL